MKQILFFFLLVGSFQLLAQQEMKPEIADPLERAIQEFSKPFEAQDYALAVELLEELKMQYPDSTEIRYFLAYAYDRLNAKDARSIPMIDRKLTVKASEELEFIIDKTPKYSHRRLALDPYAKLTAVWGSLALKHYYKGALDSMKFVLQEGEERGGFTDVLLDIGKNVLKTCSDSSILFVSGDNFSFPILYMQQLKNYRKDVQVIDISLLNTDWYTAILKNTATKTFMSTAIEYDSLPDYAISSKQRIVIPTPNCVHSKNFIWNIDRLRNGRYIIKGDSILKEIVLHNKFQDDIYFTSGQQTMDLLSLNNYFSRGILVNKLNPCGKDSIRNHQVLFEFDTRLSEQVKSSEDVLRMMDMFRMAYVTQVSELNMELDRERITSIIATMETKLPESYAPIQNQQLKNYITNLKQILEE